MRSQGVANGRRGASVDPHRLRYCRMTGISNSQMAAEARVSTRTVCDTVERQEISTRKRPQRRECQPTPFAILSNGRKKKLANGRRGGKSGASVRDTVARENCALAGSLILLFNSEASENENVPRETPKLESNAVQHRM